MSKPAHSAAATDGSMPRVSFYFDLGSPYGYLAAERLSSLLPAQVDWTPVLLGGLFKLTGRSSWALGDDRRRRAGMAEIERRARDYGLPPMRWPDPWPTDYLTAMRATVFALGAGLGREFALAAYRNAFQRGADLSRLDHVLQAARQVGLDPSELESATREQGIKQALRGATDAAFERGVIGVPTIAIDDELFWGDDRLEEAISHLRAKPAARRRPAPDIR